MLRRMLRRCLYFIIALSIIKLVSHLWGFEIAITLFVAGICADRGMDSYMRYKVYQKLKDENLTPQPGSIPPDLKL